MKIEIKDAQPAQIRAFAETMGLDINGTDNDVQVRAKLMQAWSESYIVVSEEDTADMAGTPPVNPAGDVAGERIQGGLGKEDPRVTISIANTEETKADLTPAVNGVVWQIKRATPVDVPYRVFDALMKATRTTYVQNMTTGEVTETEAPAHSITILNMPSSAEVAEWRARTDNEFLPA